MLNFKNTTAAAILGSIAALSTATSALADALFVPSQYPNIQSAIDAAQYGDQVWVENGFYQEDARLYKNGVSLRGWGDATIVGTVTIENCSDTGIWDLNLHGLDENAGDRVTIINAEEVYIGGCTFDTSYTGLVAYDSYDIHIWESKFKGHVYPLYFLRCYDVLVETSKIHRKTRDWSGVMVNDSQWVTVRNNKLKGGLVYVVDSADCTVTDNKIKRGELAAANSTRLTFARNKLIRQQSTPWSGYAIALWSVTESTIEGNVLKRTGTAGGMYISGSDLAILDNRIIRCGEFGMHIVSTGNYIDGNVGARSNQFDLFDETGGNNYYIGNTFRTSNF